MSILTKSTWRRRPALVVWAGLFALSCLPAQAQDVALVLTGANCGSQKPPPPCGLGDTLTVNFSNLNEWKTSAKVTDTSSIVLALDGRILKGLLVWDSAPNELKFQLDRSTGSAQADVDNQAAWKEILGRARQSAQFSVGVGTSDKAPPASSQFISIRVFPWYWPISIVFLAALLVFFLVLAKKSDIVRDPGPDPGKDKELCYSLARCQMAWWLFIVLGAYHYIWLVTGNWNSITSTVLVLMGISAATGLGSVAIDSGKRDQRVTLATQAASLQADIAALSAQINAQPALANIADLQAQLAQKQSQLKDTQASINSLPGGANWTSEGLLKDILRDDDGVSFHRFQLATWTVVLGFVFGVSVFQDLSMPEFSTTLLSLMGISSGTYIGFKIPDPPK